MKKKTSTSTAEMTIDMIEGVGPTTMAKLKEAGYGSVMQLAVADPYQLTIDLEVKDRDKMVGYIRAAQKLLRDTNVLENEFVSGNEALQKIEGQLKCKTGSEQLDSLLKGGVETHYITEFYGEFGSGKSQVCHTLCVLAQLPVKDGGLAGDVIYFDTENTFRPQRIQEIAIARGLDPEVMLKGVHKKHILNSSTLELDVKGLGKYVEDFKAKLVIVDSLMSLHRAEFSGMGQLATRQQRLNTLVHQLLRTAETYGVAVVTTNQVMAKPDTFFGDPTSPVGGNIIGHASTYRVYLRKSGENRVAKMVDSPYHPYSEVRFSVKAEGVCDAEDKKKKLAENVQEAEIVTE